MKSNLLFIFVLCLGYVQLNFGANLKDGNPLKPVEKVMERKMDDIKPSKIRHSNTVFISLTEAVEVMLEKMGNSNLLVKNWPNLVKLKETLLSNKVDAELNIFGDVKDVSLGNAKGPERRECIKLIIAKIRKLQQGIQQLRQRTGPGIARNEYGNAYLNLMTKVTNSPKNEVDITLPEFIKYVSKKLNSENQNIADVALTTLQFLRELIITKEDHFYAETDNVIYRVLVTNHKDDREKCLAEIEGLIKYEQGAVFSDLIFSDEEEEIHKGVPLKEAVRYTLDPININDPYEYPWPNLVKWKEMILSDQSTTVPVIDWKDIVLGDQIPPVLTLNLFTYYDNVILGKPQNPQRRECAKEIDSTIQQIQQNIRKLRQRKGPGIARDEYGHLFLNVMSRVGNQGSTSTKKETDITLPQFIKFLSKKNSANPIVLDTLKYLRRLLLRGERFFSAETDNVICKVSMYDLSQEDRDKCWDKVQKLIESQTNE